MKSQEIYEVWKQSKKRSIEKEGFTDDVMKQIYLYEQEKSRRFTGIKQLIEFISAHRFAQAALVTVGALTGFFRIACIIIMILNQGDING